MKTNQRSSYGTDARQGIRATGLMAMLASCSLALLTLSLSMQATPVSAGPAADAALCGSGFAPDYGFTYDLRQEHWTVNWQNYVSLQAVTEVDAILDQLNADSIAQTMILFQSPDQVGIRVNCAVHFLRYMRLGLPAGERKDNGFVFLIVVEPSKIDVHYGVGLGLPALTAAELTPINRAAEAAYASTGSMDEALLTLVREFDAVSRNNYAPLPVPDGHTRRGGCAGAAHGTAGPAGAVRRAVPRARCSSCSCCGWPTAWRAPGIEIGPYGSDPFSGGSSFGGGGSWGAAQWRIRRRFVGRRPRRRRFRRWRIDARRWRQRPLRARQLGKKRRLQI